MAIKTRNYFKGKKTPAYKDDQLNFIDSVAYKNDTTDNASTTQSGLVRTVSDANALSRTDPTGYTGALQPHQQSTNIQTVTGDHVLVGAAVIGGGLALYTYSYDGGKRYDYRWAAYPGSPGGGTNIDCIGAGTSGIYLKASDTIFETSGGNLNIKTNGLALDKLVALTGNMGLVTDAAGEIIASTASDTQINALSAIGNSKIVVTTGAGVVTGSSVVTLSELAYLGSVTAGTSAASKAVVLSGAGKIDTIDITSLVLNGSSVTATATQINYTAVTPGTRTVNKAIVVDGSGKINALDITALTLNGTAITSVANDINLLAGKAAGGLTANDIACLIGADGAGVSAADIQKIAGAGSTGVDSTMLSDNANYQFVTVNVSFETGYTGEKCIVLGFTGDLIKIDAVVDKAIEGSNDATITFQDALGNNMGGTSLVAGALTLTAGSAMGTVFSTDVTSNNTIAEDGKLYIDTRKTTAGGTAWLSLKFEKAG